MILKTLPCRYLAFLSLLVMLSVTSCKEDPDTNHNVIPPPSNRLSEMQVHNTTYRLDVMALKDYGLASGNAYSGHKIELLVLTEGMQLFEAGGQIDSVSGDGKLVSIELFSSEEGELTPGMYAFHQDYGRVATFNKAYIIDYINGKSDSNSRFEIQTGTLRVSRDDGVYSLEGELMDDEKKAISFYQKGVPEYYTYK